MVINNSSSENDFSNNKLKLVFSEDCKKKVSYISDIFFSLQDIDKNKILIITRNKTLENSIRNSILSKIDIKTEEINIFRFRAFISKLISENWFFLYKKPPNFLGFYETFLYLKEFVNMNKENFEGEILDKKFITKLFERHQRLADNNINLINDDKTKKYDLFLDKFSNYLMERDSTLLDYSGQLKAINKLLVNNDFIKKMNNQYKYWIIDGIEDSVLSEQKFYEHFWNNNNFLYLSNPYGGLREFLGANPYYIEELKKKVNEVEELEIEKNLFYDVGQTLYEIINSEEHRIIDTNNLDRKYFELYDSKSYLEMLDSIDNIIKKITIESPNSEICIITNSIDDLLESEIEYIANNKKYLFESVRGVEVIAKNQIIKSITTILRIIFNDEISQIENFPLLKPFDFSQLVFTTQNKSNFELAKLRKNFKNDYQKWFEFINNEYKNLNTIISYGIENKGLLNKTSDYLDLIMYIWKKLFWQNTDIISENIKDINNLLKSCKSYVETAKFFFKEQPFIYFINDIIKGDFSNSPDVFLEPKKNNIKLITLQKLSESSYKSDYQIWFNSTSEKWLKKETHPIYNPYLFSLQSKGLLSTFNNEEIICTKEFSKKIKVAFNLCNKKIFITSSDYDIMGEKNDYELLKDFFSS